MVTCIFICVIAARAGESVGTVAALLLRTAFISIFAGPNVN